MSLFEEPVWCEHGREPGKCVFCRQLPARSGDPQTSRNAGSDISDAMKDEHFKALEYLRRHGPMTDDHLAQVCVDLLGLTKRSETARRWIRTLREKHNLICPALDEDGIQIEMLNESGRMALAWEVRDWG